MHNKKLLSLLALLTGLLGACSSSDSSDSGFGPSNQFSLFLSGVVTYTFYPVTEARGLDYDSAEERPIRGAQIEIQDLAGSVLNTGQTGTDGSYSIGVPEQQMVRLVIKAALGTAQNNNTEIRDNTAGNALYALFTDINIGESSVALDMNANSGWNGVRYADERDSAPFAILDTVFDAQQYVLTADPAVDFGLLTIYWSPQNRAVEGTLSAGEIGGTFYSNGSIWLVGAENVDTEEYDRDIILHEWAHYYMDQFSRSDSIGGPHGIGELLDLTVAFSEGFANAFAGLVAQEPLLLDSFGSQQSSLGYFADLEADTIDDSETEQGVLLDGHYSESSVQEVLYDLIDAPVADDDALSLSFQQLHSVFTGPLKQTPAFTAIFALLQHLKSAQPAWASEIELLAANENIQAGNEYEDSQAPFIYTDLLTTSAWVSQDANGEPLQTKDDFGAIEEDFVGNHYLNRSFFNLEALSSGCFRLDVDPLASGDMAIYLGTGYLDNGLAGETESLILFANTGQSISVAVGSFSAPATFRIRAVPVQAGC